MDSDMIGGVAVNHLSPKVVEIMPKDGVVVDKLDIQMLEGGLSNCFAEVEALLLNAEFSFSMSFEGMRQLLKTFLNVKTLAFVYHNKHSKDVGRLIAQVAVLGVDDGVIEVEFFSDRLDALKFLLEVSGEAKGRLIE